MNSRHHVVLHTFQQNPSTLFYLLFPCVKCGCIARTQFRNITIDELLQPIIIQHYLHPILPCSIIKAAIKGILQSQPIERHFNVYSTSTARIFCSKFELSTSTNSLHNFNIQSTMSDTMYKLYALSMHMSLIHLISHYLTLCKILNQFHLLIFCGKINCTHM